ncbi:MAG: hypothetical protein COT18_11455 [Elusimicrobia bacterium CG08_land_8_20_14_0_20_59_10]|nr:MAG: hypothetical protein COT18_11455 [Elusimicrobia bacterium CG08_land_8_20_14_0_20_59_10]
MKALKKIFNALLLPALVLLSFNTAEALTVSFDGSTVSLPAAAVQAPEVSRPQPAAALSASSARVYDFKALWKGLGYPALGQYGESEDAVRSFGATDDEVMDLATYTSKDDAYYREINNYLRYHPLPYEWYGISPEYARGMVKNIDSVFSKVPSLPADLMLFRGLDLQFRDSRPYAMGEEFSDKGYVSTSVSYKVARYFAVEMNDNADTPSRKAVFAIYLSRAEKGILVDHAEDEVILPRAMKFKVMAKKDGVKKYDLYLVQACSGACASAISLEAASFWTGLSVQD